MAFDAHDRTLDLIRALAPLRIKIAEYDPDLAKQLRRAANSILLNIDEGARRIGRDRKNRFRAALGSTDEVRGATEAIVAWGDLGRGDIAAALAAVDRVRAILSRLAH